MNETKKQNNSLDRYDLWHNTLHDFLQNKTSRSWAVGQGGWVGGELKIKANLSLARVSLLGLNLTISDITSYMIFEEKNTNNYHEMTSSITFIITFNITM